MNRRNRTFHAIGLLSLTMTGLLGCMPTTAATKPARTAPVVIARPTGPLCDPKKVLGEAIQAMGGEAGLKRRRQNYCTGEGMAIMLNQPQRFRFKTISALPDR